MGTNVFLMMFSDFCEKELKNDTNEFENMHVLRTSNGKDFASQVTHSLRPPAATPVLDSAWLVRSKGTM